MQAPEVAYQGGPPEFQPIEKTTVQRAVNTDKDILKVGDLYYMCFQGVWFMSKTPTGPWAVTGEVPKQIYEIPVSSPSHAVTYVTVEESNDDAVVFATAAAFTGAMVAWGCVVWGTGYYYPPYVWYGGGYPIYYPHYPTYGFGASYNPWTGAYTRGAAVYGPYGGAGVAARYNPRTGTYSRGAVAYGPYGARGAAQAYNPRTGAYGATRQGSNVYGSWGATGVQRGDRLGHHRAVHEQRHRHDDARHPDQRGRRGRQPFRARRPRDGRSEPAAATSTPARTATSTGSRATAGSSTARAAGTASRRHRNSASRHRTERRKGARRREIERLPLAGIRRPVSR